MRKLIISLFLVITVVSTVQSQRLLIVNDSLAIDVKDIDHISYAADQQSPYRLICEQLAMDSKTTLFYQALQMTGLIDSLLVYEDENYPTNLSGQAFPVKQGAGGRSVPCYYLTSRPRRFTVFVETDSVFRAAGINNIDDLKAWAKTVYDEVFPQDASISDPTNRCNSLNRFVSYHILRHAAGYAALTPVNDRNTRLADHMPGTTSDVATFYETMMPFASLKCSYPRGVKPDGIYLNRRGLKDNYTVRGIHIMQDGGDYDHWTDNGDYFYIDSLLVYDKTTQEKVLHDIWRVDFKDLSPDLLNLGFRQEESPLIGIPGGYVDNIDTDAEVVILYPHSTYWLAYEGDAVSCPNMKRLTVKLPPLPAGQWQVRLGYSSGAERPVINTYINGVLQFSNIDLRELKLSVDADDNLFHGPDDYFLNGSIPMSSYIHNYRIVVGSLSSDGSQDYYLTFEVTIPEFDYWPIDFLEFVPI